MAGDNGAPVADVQPMIVLEIRIQYMPQAGQFKVAWPQVDDVARMGMLEMAKSTLLEGRVKAAVGIDSKLVVASRLPPS